MKQTFFIKFVWASASFRCLWRRRLTTTQRGAIWSGFGEERVNVT